MFIRAFAYRKLYKKLYMEVQSMSEQEVKLSTKYDPKSVEENRYQYWLDGKFLKQQTMLRKSPTQS